MFVKNIITGSISIVDNLRISLFKPLGLRKVIKSIPYDNYVIGVGYIDGDFQIGISGRKKINETLMETLQREMSEELSIYPRDWPCVVGKNGNNHFYKLNINKTSFVTNVKKNINLDTKERIIACIYGNETDILDYLHNVKLDKDNEDSITHIWADKASNLIRYVKI